MCSDKELEIYEKYEKLGNQQKVASDLGISVSRVGYVLRNVFNVHYGMKINEPIKNIKNGNTILYNPIKDIRCK